MSLQRTDPPPEQDEQLWQTASVLSALACPEALKVLRRVAVRPSSAREICALESDLTEREVVMCLAEFASVDLVESYSKSGTYRLTELGRLAVRAVRQLGH